MVASIPPREREESTASTTTGVESPATAKLTNAKLGTASLVFMIIAASAPLTVLAGGVPTNFAVSGLLGVPWSYLVLGLILVFFAIGYGVMSSRIQNSGAFYAYVSEGLGNRLGISAAFVALVSYNLMQIGLYGIFGFSLANLLNGFGLLVPWWGAAAVGWIIVVVLGVRNVDLSAKLLGILVFLEFVVVTVVSLISLGVAPEGVTTQTAIPSQFFANGIGVLLAFGIAAFMGFESGAIYSEEAKDPERTVPRATYIAVGLIAVFYAASAWAFAQGIGPSQIIAQSSEFGPDLLFVWLGEYSHLGATIANVLFVTSLMAALVAFHNAAARYFFSLGRSHVLSPFFAKTAANGAPLAGSLAQSCIAVVVVAVFALAGAGSELGDLYPVLTLFTWLTNTAALGLVFLLAVVSVSIIVWMNREQKEKPLFVRVIAPLVATAGLAMVFLLVILNFPLMVGGEAGSSAVWILPGVVIAAALIGVGWGEFLRHARPEIYQRLKDNLDQL